MIGDDMIEIKNGDTIYSVAVDGELVGVISKRDVDFSMYDKWISLDDLIAVVEFMKILSKNIREK